jgi:chromosome partitioning protein
VDLIKQTDQENLDIVQGSMWLYTGERELANKSGREYLLRKAMRGIKGYDYVLIDTSPSLGLMTLNAWVASHGLLVPISLTTYGMLGIRILEYSLAKESRSLELNVPILGVIGVLDDHTKQSAKMLSTIKEHFGNLLFGTILPRNIRVEEANNQSISLFDYAPNSSGAKAYVELTKEILERIA